MSKQIKVPWKNGYYYNKSYTGLLTKVEGNLAYSYITGMKVEFPDAKPICDTGTWKYGDFGPANQEVQKASGGVKNYNVELDLWAGTIQPIFFFGHFLDPKILHKSRNFTNQNFADLSFFLST